MSARTARGCIGFGSPTTCVASVGSLDTCVAHARSSSFTRPLARARRPVTTRLSQSATRRSCDGTLPTLSASASGSDTHGGCDPECIVSSDERTAGGTGERLHWASTAGRSSGS